MLRNEEAERVGWLWGRLRSQVDSTPHPTDGLEAWRARWADVRQLVDELDQEAGTT